jgi:hypothetical protein
LDIFPFGPAPKNRLIGWWEIGTLLVSFVLSALASGLFFRSCKKYILSGRQS